MTSCPRIFDAAGVAAKSWRAPEEWACLAAAPDGRVYVGAGGRVAALLVPPAEDGRVQGDPGVDLERAAGSLGAGAWRSFVHVTFPLIRPAVLTAALLAFLTSFDEVVVALFLSGSGAVTLPKKMYESIRFDTDPTIIAASTVLVIITTAILGVCALMQRRGTPDGAMLDRAT